VPGAELYVIQEPSQRSRTIGAQEVLFSLQHAHSAS
jgi:hypothetical protein